MPKQNPFVGPRPLQKGESLYGRSTEVRELFHRLQARRIVVLHAPSGAGKTSLVQAGLIPRLKEERFDVWKPIRVNLDPHSLEGIPAGTNRYLLSAMVSLEEELPRELRRDLEELASLDLLTYVRGRPRFKERKDRPVVLLFDQFEEVLTLAPHDIEQKRDFFDAVGRALEDERTWALFIVRDDYLAAFAPYASRIPTQMSTTFRIDLLGLESATEIVEKSAEECKIAFPAAKQLVRDLAMIQVQRSDGKFELEVGRHVEPVYLQVVCRRLWDTMPNDKQRIEEADIAQHGNVSTALGDYYAREVGEIAAGDVSVERKVREWVGRKLIAGGIRSQVRMGEEQSEGLGNDLIKELCDRYLVRAEPRGGMTWFELSHDRLVKPVEQSNQAWEETHLHPLQVQARLWDEQKRAPRHLLGREALGEAITWAETNDERLNDVERAFLEQSRERCEQEAREQRRQRLITIAAVVVAVVVSVVGIWAWVQGDRANEARAKEQQAREKEHVAQQVAHRLKCEARNTSIVANARDLAEETQPPVKAASWLLDVTEPAETNRWDRVATSILRAGLPELTMKHDAPVNKVVLDGAGKRIATLSRDNAVSIWNVDGSGTLGLLSGTHRTVEWSPDNKRLLTVSDDAVRIWNADSLNAPTKELKGHDYLGASWNPMDNRFMTVSEKVVTIWTTDGVDKLGELHLPDAFTHAWWSPDGERILTRSSKGTLDVWDVDSGTSITLGTDIAEHTYQAEWNIDNERILTLSDEMRVRIWTADGFHELKTYVCHSGNVRTATWSPDGELIVTAGDNKLACVWDAKNSNEALKIFRDDERLVSASFNPNKRKGKRLMTRSIEGVVTIRSLEELPDKLVRYKVASERVNDAVWSADGEHILTASEDKTVRVWKADGSSNPLVFEGRNPFAPFLSWSPSGAHIAMVYRTVARVQKVDGTGATVPLNAPTSLESDDFTTHASWRRTDGKRIVIAANKIGYVWNADVGGKPLVTLRGHTDKIVSAAWSPDGQRIVTASHDMTARVWDATHGNELRALKGHEKKVVSAAWSPDGQRIVTASDDTTARVWDAIHSDEPRVLKGHEKEVVNAAWSPDSQRIVTASNDKTARVWDAIRGDELFQLQEHEKEVVNAAWSPDGKHIVTASNDGTARVWDAHAKGKLLRTLESNGSAVDSAVWSPNGKRILTRSSDGKTRVWNEDWAMDPLVIEETVGIPSWDNMGNRILVGSKDHDAQIYIVDVPSLRKSLRDAMLDYIAPDERKQDLFQSDSESPELYTQCLHLHGPKFSSKGTSRPQP